MTISYHFKIDELPSKIDDFEFPDSYQECMITRARFHGFHDNDTEEMLETVQISERDEASITKLLSVYSDDKDLINQEVAENIFGYVFAKGIEDYAFTELNLVPVSGYSFHAFDGILDTGAEGWLNEKLEYAMKYGKQFLKDFKNYMGPEDIYITEMMEALKYVLALTKACAPDYLSQSQDQE